MALVLRLLLGLQGVTKEGFSLAQDDCGSSIAALRGLLGKLGGEFIDRMLETFTQNTSGRHGDVPVKAQSSFLERRVLAVLLSFFRHMRLSFYALRGSGCRSVDTKSSVIIQRIAFLLLNAQDCSQPHFMAFIRARILSISSPNIILDDSLRLVPNQSVHNIYAV